jgi:putative MATE family efflux protein
MDNADLAPPAPILETELPVEELPSVGRRVLALAWPVLLQQLLILSVQLSDRYLAGNYLEEISYQAAQTNAQYLTWFLTSFTVLISVGSTALVARLVGAGDRASANRVTDQSILLATVFGLAIGVIGLLGAPSLVRLLQLHGDAADAAVAYLFPLFFLYVFQMVESAGIACLIGAGDTRTGMYVLGGIALINLPLAWALMPVLGFAGIAWGTAISRALGAVVVMTVLAKGRAGLRWTPRYMWPDWRLIWRILRVSVPAGADSLSVAAGHLWFLSIVNGLGEVASGAHGIAIGWEALGYMSGYAFGTAAMALVGQYLGAKRPDLAAQSVWTAFRMALLYMCLMGVVFFTLAPQMFELFCTSDKQAVIDVGVPVLRLVAFAMPAVACCFIFTFALRGAGDTRVPVLFTWIGFLCVRIPLAYFLADERVDLGALGTLPGANLGLFGAWLAMFADLFVRGGFFLYRFAGGRWKQMKV